MMLIRPSHKERTDINKPSLLPGKHQTFASLVKKKSLLIHLNPSTVNTPSCPQATTTSFSLLETKELKKIIYYKYPPAKQ